MPLWAGTSLHRSARSRSSGLLGGVARVGEEEALGYNDRAHRVAVPSSAAQTGCKLCDAFNVFEMQLKPQ